MIKSNKLQNFSIAILFLLISLILSSGLFFSEGIILGGDWNFPYMNIGMKELFENNFINTWTTQGNLFGFRQMSHTSLLFNIVVFIFSNLSVTGGLFSKILVLSLFFFAAYSMYSLLKFFKIKGGISFLGGIAYITLPIFFDYAIMGWIFVLFVMGLFPIAVRYFIKAVEENRLIYAIVVGIIYAISVIQSQSLFWFPMIFFLLGIYLIRDKKSFIHYSKTLVVVLLLFFLLNFYWIFGLLVAPDKGISGSDIVNSVVSTGTMGNFQPHNFIRLFGGLFNFQYETVVGKSNLLFLSFLVPLLAFGAFFVKEKRRLVLSFFLISLVPLFFYFLNDFRYILINIPFSNVIRDFARFMTLSSFAYIVLFAISLDYIFTRGNKEIYYKYAGFGIIFLWFLSIFPWWTGELTNWKDSAGSDMRIRTKVFPSDYIEVENIFAKKKLDQKALYLPLGGNVDFTDDIKFHGAFNETQDIFAGYSPIPGVLGISDRSHGYTDEFIKSIKNSNDLYKTLKNTSVKYFVVRKNLLMNDRDEILQIFEENQDLYNFFDKDNVIVYARKDFFPHFSSPEEKYGALEFKKINPTKYWVRVHSASGKFPLVFSESFHDGWRAYAAQDVKIPPNPPFTKGEDLDSYKILDGNEDDQASKEELKEYINKGWVTDLGPSYESKPQQNFDNFEGAGEIKHTKWVDGKEELDYVEKYNIDFISKNFQGTIQNDNLPEGKFWETWLPRQFSISNFQFSNKSQSPISKFKTLFENKSVVELPEEDHLMVNGYANSWVVDVDEICAKIPPNPPFTKGGINGFCVKNSDGTYDLELVVEFWPQRLFYIGLFISGSTLALCLAYLIYDWRKKRKPEVAGPTDKKV